MTTPTTAAGRALRTALWGAFAPGVEHDDVTVTSRILAIEAEARAAALDEARAAVLPFLLKYGLANTSGERHQARRVARDAAIDALRERSGIPPLPPPDMVLIEGTPENIAWHKARERSGG